MLKSAIRIDSFIAMVGKSKKKARLEILDVICFGIDLNSRGTTKKYMI